MYFFLQMKNTNTVFWYYELCAYKEKLFMQYSICSDAILNIMHLHTSDSEWKNICYMKGTE